MSRLGIVLAAGLGTRLRPLTLERPKPAVPVANRPMAAFSMDHLRAAEVERLRLNAHYLPGALERVLGPYGVEEGWAVVQREETLLGTGGGVRALLAGLRPDPHDDIVVMNGDVLFAPNLERAVRAHRDSGAFATMVARRAPGHPAGRALGLRMEGAQVGRVERILGDPAADRGLEPALFTGVHVLSAEVFGALPVEGCIIQRGYRRWVADGRRVSAVLDDAPFWDLGTLPDYLEANLSFAQDGSLIAPTAQVQATAGRSVVGEGAIVRAPIEESVVWDGATVDAPLRRAVATPAGVVMAD